MSITEAAVTYLAVSIENVLFQALALWWLIRHGAQRSSVRTIGFRVGVALIYVGIGTINLIFPLGLSLTVTLVVFSAVQVMWQGNSVVDLLPTLRKPATLIGDDRTSTASPRAP